MSTPVTISSETEKSAQTISSAESSVVAITVTSSSEHVPAMMALPEEDAVSSTIEHVESSDDLELLEAEVQTARARREEREAIERLARARRVRSSATSMRSRASTISSARFDPTSGPGEQQYSGTFAALSGPGRGAGVGQRAPGPVTGAGGPLPAESPSLRDDHVPTLPTSSAPQAPAARPEPGWLQNFMSSISVRDRVIEIEGQAQSAASDDGKGVMRLLEERVQELEQQLARTASRASFESVVSAPPGLTPFAKLNSEDEGEFTHAVDDALHAWYSTTERTTDQRRSSAPHKREATAEDSARACRSPAHPPSGPGGQQYSGTCAAPLGPGEGPGVGRRAPGPVSGAGSLPPAESPPPCAPRPPTPPVPKPPVPAPAPRVPAPPPPPPPPPPAGDDGDSNMESTDSDEEAGAKRRKRKGPYKVKNAEMRLPSYPSMPAFQSWRRHVRTAAISACERPERARDFVFSVESDGATFESLAISDTDRHRALDAKLADALLKIVKGDLARRLAVMSERLAMSGQVLAGRQILFLIYKEFAKDSHQTDCQSYTHLEKMQGSKDIKGLETFLTVWDNLMQSFRTPPKPDHLYTAFLSKIRHVPELAEPIKKLNRLPWDDPKKTYESLREECDFVIEEARQERVNQQLEKLYESGSVATALAATPEEKAKLPCFFVRDGKTCPNGKSCPYSHQKDIIEKAKKAKEAKQAGKGKEGDKSKSKGGKDKDKDKKGGKGKGKGKICPYFNDKGCNFGSACKMLHEAPAMAANQTAASSSQANPAPKAKAAATPKPAAGEQAKA